MLPGSTDDEVIKYDYGIILGSAHDELLGSALGASDGIKLRLDKGTELGSPDGSFDGS